MQFLNEDSWSFLKVFEMNKSLNVLSILLVSALSVSACNSDLENKSVIIDECDVNFPCADINQYCNSEHKCVDKKIGGIVCAVGLECQSGQCVDYHCTQASSVVLPECSETQACADSTKYCDVHNQKCLSKKTDGMICESAVECISGLCNRLKQCGSEPSEDPSGHPECSETQGCADNTKYCDDQNHKCLPKKSDGQTCQTDGECLTNHCNSKNQCGEDVIEYTSCREDGDCQNSAQVCRFNKCVSISENC